MKANNEIFDENNLLQRISDGTAAETGSRFFRAVVKNLSQALGTCGAWITEYLVEARRLRALAFWLGSDFVEHYEYDIAGTPCEASLKNKRFLHIPENVIERGVITARQGRLNLDHALPDRNNPENIENPTFPLDNTPD